MRYSKILILTLVVISIAAVYSYAGIDDRSDRLSNEQSSVFSPGYINATKQHTDEIIRQVNSNSSALDRNVDNVDYKLTNNVDEAAVSKVNPELQKKTGGGESKQRSVPAATTQSVPLALPATNSNTADIPAYMRDAVRKNINDNLGNSTMSGDYQIKYSSGNYYAIWQQVDQNNNSSIEIQIFDSAANAFYANPVTLSGTDSPCAGIENFSALSNGDIAVFWHEGMDIGYDGWVYNPYVDGPSSDPNAYSYLKAQVFNSAGNTIYDTPITLTGADLSYSANIENVSEFGNGNMAVFWNEEDFNQNSVLKTQMFDSSGKTLYDTPVTLSSGDSLLSTSIGNVSTLSNGNTLVFWSEVGSNWNESSIKAQAFDSNGNILYDTPITLNEAGSSSTGISNVSTFANGNIAVFWDEAGSAIKAQILDSSGNTICDTPITIARTDPLHGANMSVSALADGNMAVVWSSRDSHWNTLVEAQILDSNGTALYDTPITLNNSNDKNFEWLGITNVSALANGNIAVFWDEEVNAYTSYIKAQVLDQYGNALYSAPATISGSGGVYLNNVFTLANGDMAVVLVGPSIEVKTFDSYGSLLHDTPIATIANSGYEGLDPINISTLANGDKAIFWWGFYNGQGSTEAQVFDPSSGDVLYNTPITLGSGGPSTRISNVSLLDNGDMAVFWDQKSQVIDKNGNFVSSDALKQAIQDTVSNDLTKSPLLNLYADSFADYSVKSSFYESSDVSSFGKDVSDISKTLLTNGSLLAQDINSPQASAQVFKEAIKESLREYALAIPAAVDMNMADMKVAVVLASILKNPTDDQKLILDTVIALLNDTKNMEDKNNASPESLKKAQDDLIQTVAALLIAQAIPDLLKDGDVNSIKGTFADLNTEKGKILLDYQEAVKPYYDKMKEILNKNMATLQLNNVIPGNMMAAELAKLEPNEIDKILEKLRKASNKSFEEDYILQQEAKYRKAYIDPNKKILEEKIKYMMNSFTQRLSKILGETKSAKK